MKDKDKKLKAEEKEGNVAEEQKAPVQNEEIEKLNKLVEELRAKFEKAEKNFEDADKDREEWKNKYYGAYADMANLRKQVEKEANDFKKYAAKSLLEELLPIIDTFDLALKNEPKDENIRKYLQGFQMIHNKLLNTLQNVHVTIIDPKVGDDYNPNCMQAYSTVEGEEDNKIAEVFTKGYMLYEHLLRPAGVIVTIKAAPKATENVSTDSKEESENK